MSAISNISANTRGWQPQRPDVAKMSEDLFAKLDTNGQGSIDEAGLSSALTQLGGSDSNATTLLKGLDGNGDSKVTKEELSDGMQKLADQFEAQFNSSRTTHAHPGQPPASPEDTFAALDSDGGGSIDKTELKAALGQDQGTAIADEVFGKLDTDGNKLISQEELAQGLKGGAETGAAERSGQAQGAGGPPPGGGPNAATASETQYDAADSNEDGTVSIEERLAYQAEQAAKREETTQAGKDAALDKLLGQLAKTYGTDSAQSNEPAVSVTA